MYLMIPPPKKLIRYVVYLMTDLQLVTHCATHASLCGYTRMQ